MPKKKSQTPTLEIPTAVEVKETGADAIRNTLEKIKTREGIIGYILRNAKSASIDIKDPTKIIDYAILSSSALDAAEELSSTFNLGDVKSIVVEGEAAKVLAMTIDENKISVFMEKTVDHEKICKELNLP